MSAIKELLRDGIAEEVKHLAGSYLQAYLVGWAEDIREARLREKLISLRAARLKMLDIIDSLED